MTERLCNPDRAPSSLGSKEGTPGNVSDLQYNNCVSVGEVDYYADTYSDDTRPVPSHAIPLHTQNLTS